MVCTADLAVMAEPPWKDAEDANAKIPVVLMGETVWYRENRPGTHRKKTILQRLEARSLALTFEKLARIHQCAPSQSTNMGDGTANS